jgi:hypothetical protein
MQKRSNDDWRDVCTGAVGAGALLLGSYGLGAMDDRWVIGYAICDRYI